MRLLLDTHVWVWYLTASDDLPPQFREVIEASDSEVFLSPISIWEVLILSERGRINLRPNPEAWVRDATKSFPTIEAPLSSEIAIQSRSIDLPHPDPADRFIAATALVNRAVLLTLDRRLVNAPSVPTYRS